MKLYETTVLLNQEKDQSRNPAKNVGQQGCKVFIKTSTGFASLNGRRVLHYKFLLLEGLTEKALTSARYYSTTASEAIKCFPLCLCVSVVNVLTTETQRSQRKSIDNK